MKFLSFRNSGAARLGVLADGGVIDLAAAQPTVSPDFGVALASGVDLIAAAKSAIASSAPRLPLAGIEYAPVVPRPGKIICLGLNYYDHAKEGGREKPDYPWFFFRGATSLIAHGESGLRPRVSDRFDYEAELAVVIGQKAKHLTQANALDCVFGYSCFNDMSVRDYQKKTPQWTIGKNFDGTGGFGPVLVTKDELSPGATGLRIQSRLNGEVMQDANTTDMIWGVAETIQLLTECMTLEPGDTIIMGTPAGVGQARKPPVWMKHGDTIEIEIEKVGLLSNPIVDETYMPPMYAVAIVGFGPCGAVAAALLGTQGIQTWVCDKSVDIYDKPRAFALDHEIMRVFQQLGIHDQVLAHSEPFTPSEFYGVQGQLIKRFTTVEPPYPLAFPPSLVFNQPATERILRNHVATLSSVHVALGCEVVGLTQDSEQATLRVRSGTDGETTQIRARYVIACDGASSTVRGLVNIALDDLGFDQPWLVVDVLVNDEGARKLPKVSVQYCEPARPTTYLIGPGNHRRWEISINEGEDPQRVSTAEGTWKLLSRWITPSDGTLWRQASYRFHALVAERWRSGRVFVAGDAAHQQPPFLGQGMCQGIRDVANLCWKLGAVLQAGAADSLLDTYGLERKAHVQALTTRIKNIGLLIGERDAGAAKTRDENLLAECGGIVKSVPRQDVQPALSTGLLAPQTTSATGTIFPQPWLGIGAGAIRMDDIAGWGWRVVLDQDAPAEFGGASKGLNAVKVIAIGSHGCEDVHGIAHNWFAKHACSAAIVRPDHYVYGVASSPEQLAGQLQSLQKSLYQGDSHAT